MLVSWLSLESPMKQRCHVTERNKNAFPWSYLTKAKSRLNSLCLLPSVCLPHESESLSAWRLSCECSCPVVCVCVWLLCDLCVSVSRKGRTQTFVLFLLNSPGRRLGHFAGNSSRLVKGLSATSSDLDNEHLCLSTIHGCFQPLYLLSSANVAHAFSGSRAWKSR